MVTPSTGSTPTYIRYEPERTDLTLTESELERICSAANNHWKDFFLVSISVALPCLINAIASTSKPFALSLPLFLNYLIGALGLALAIVFGISWHRTRVDLDKLVESIKAKPKYMVQIGQTAAGDNPAITLRHDNGAG